MMTTTRDRRGWRQIALPGAVSLLVFAVVAAAVLAHATDTVDGGVRRWALSHQHAVLVSLSLLVTSAGGITGMRVLAAAGAMDLWRRGCRGGAAWVLGVTVASWGAFTAMKSSFARPRPGPLGAGAVTDYAFPSGHAVVSAAVCGTLAYMYWRRGVVGTRAALSFSVLVPFAVGSSRLYLDVHWATDVLGGWSAGVLVAAIAMALHERVGSASPTFPS